MNRAIFHSVINKIKTFQNYLVVDAVRQAAI